MPVSSTSRAEGESSDNNNNNNSVTLKIMYFNARSLLPKLDELMVLADDSNPDVICITETWLSGEISDNELSIVGYLLYRRDRDRHGGGVLLYVRESIQVKLPPQCPDLELLTLSLYKGNNRICLAVFYHPPSTPTLVFSQVSAYFDNLCITQFSNFIFLGDFNVNVRDPTHHWNLNDIMSLYFTVSSCRWFYAYSS